MTLADVFALRLSRHGASTGPIVWSGCSIDTWHFSATFLRQLMFAITSLSRVFRAHPQARPKRSKRSVLDRFVINFHNKLAIFFRGNIRNVKSCSRESDSVSISTVLLASHFFLDSYYFLFLRRHGEIIIVHNGLKNFAIREWWIFHCISRRIQNRRHIRRFEHTRDREIASCACMCVCIYPVIFSLLSCNYRFVWL